jgi:hypothetical protein
VFLISKIICEVFSFVLDPHTSFCHGTGVHYNDLRKAKLENVSEQPVVFHRSLISI